MSTPRLATFVLGLALVAGVAGARPVSADPASQTAETKQHWQDAKRALRRGDYRDALQSLDILDTLTPDDPWVQLYKALVTLRLESAQTIPQASAAQLREMRQRLHDEERLRHRFGKEQKQLERQVKQEQAAWDTALQHEQRTALRDEQVKRKTAHRETARQARTERAVQQERAVRDVGVQGAVRGAGEQEAVRDVAVGEAVDTAEEAEAPLTRASVAEDGSIELAPIAVTTTRPEPETPSLAGRPKPPAGAVQINARQMSVSPDKKVAIAEGDVEVISEDALLTCDRMTLFTDTKDVYAEGKVRIEQGAQVFRGEMAHYNFANKKGRFLQGTVSAPPWHEHGRSVEHIAEGVYQVTPGYLTSCDLEPPHFRFFGKRATVFADDKLARMRNVALLVERVPFLYLPWLTVADRQSPFFLIPGKKKPWGAFALMGYRYELPTMGTDISQSGTIKVDWRNFFGWGFGADHRIESPKLGQALLKLYYNQETNKNRPFEDLPKGAHKERYRVLWRHRWQPLPDTTVITDLQEFSDADFRQEFLFREEFSEEEVPESFISSVTSTSAYTLSGLVRKRLNRFQSVDEVLPQVTFDVREQRIGDSWLFSSSRFDVTNFQRKTADSGQDDDVVRVDWFEQLKYAVNWFRPVEVTPRAGVRQTYYTKDRQGSDRHDALRDVISGQASAGVDASLKLFRIFPVVSNAFGLNLNMLRHVVTPTVGYSYTHQPTVPNTLLTFPAANGPANEITWGLENKLQTRRPAGPKGQLRSTDLARLLLSIPYAFHSAGNKIGGQLGDWKADLELYPWTWMRLESDLTILSHLDKTVRDSRLPTFNADLVLVGGDGTLDASKARDIEAPLYREFDSGPRLTQRAFLPQGQWYFGLGHRYSQNDKTEDVIQFDWRLTEKWELGTFHRFTWKEVAGGAKRFRNMREFQYSLRRDLHDWLAEFVYRVDREFGDEIFFTLSLKAYPEMPIEFGTSYHQPKAGSQSSPFSPVRAQ